MKKKITVISCVIFVAAMMMFAQPAMSGKFAATPSGLDLQILSASVLEVSDPPEGHFFLLILGYNFGNGDEPIVKLAGTPCQFVFGGDFGITHEGEALWGIVIACTVPIPILTELPLPFPVLTANLLLTVQTGPSVHQFDTFNVMLPDMTQPEPLNTSDLLLLLQ